MVSNTVSEYARKLGELLLNKDTANDGTAQTQRAYKDYIEQQAAQGLPALPLNEWIKTRR